MKYKPSPFILLVGFLVFIMTACNSGPAQPKIDPTQGAQMLAGTYTTTITSEDVANFSISKDPAMANNQGDWQFILTNDGKFTAEMGGKFMAEGNYTVKNNRIEVYIQSACEDCGCEAGIGRYIWALNSDSLSFSKTAGSCYGMDLVLTSHSLNRISDG